ncbi:hypothetical protein MTR67_017499 [Solanum verrucosum]|uniref:Uncharacterized protein n=1 Tax=Solanum verrucosum TaxID=315347 RepID=A0AAF0TLW1_SOLVR|nr:hypothetical protein MTR67_017499 [Solanum verrucosum]
MALFDTLYGRHCRSLVGWLESTRSKPHGDRVFLRVLPIKGVMRFWRRDKLIPRCIGPFNILWTVGEYDAVDLDDRLASIEEPFSILERYVELVALENHSSGNGPLEESISMTWLSPYYTGLNCNTKLVTLDIPGRERLEWEGVYKPKLAKIISSIRARKLVGHGCLAYLAHIWDVEVESPSIEYVPVVYEFKEVFPMDFPSMPPGRDIDFCIDLKTGTRPIFIPPYHMAPTELRELKAQNQELHDKGSIHPSASP